MRIGNEERELCTKEEYNIKILGYDEAETKAKIKIRPKYRRNAEAFIIVVQTNTKTNNEETRNQLYRFWVRIGRIKTVAVHGNELLH